MISLTMHGRIAKKLVFLPCCRFDVPDVEAACKRFEELGVQFVKKPNDGRMKGLAFIKVNAYADDCTHDQTFETQHGQHSSKTD